LGPSGLAAPRYIGSIQIELPAQFSESQPRVALDVAFGRNRDTPNLSM